MHAYKTRNDTCVHVHIHIQYGCNLTSFVRQSLVAGVCTRFVIFLNCHDDYFYLPISYSIFYFPTLQKAPAYTYTYIYILIRIESMLYVQGMIKIWVVTSTHRNEQKSSHKHVSENDFLIGPFVLPEQILFTDNLRETILLENELCWDVRKLFFTVLYCWKYALIIK